MNWLPLIILLIFNLLSGSTKKLALTNNWGLGTKSILSLT